MPDENEVRTGERLLREWGCETREQKLERACMALIHAVSALHLKWEKQDLTKPNEYFCECADAYNMGIEALRKVS